ncbi:hypothetical protein ABD91_26165 [Lysinibacillus sphaericus]|uniref:hypothetical protein n=1 Tax=Lysinibacillus sphaericus TaxID=1421 RepID=UPI0018CE7BDC|nr:hypothetical protein [Lysinibacillus sphaericus]MBG9694218.1 hypothetical protein [Lysinibacillus sphaericus]
MKHEKFKVVALEDLTADYNSWKKGEVYEVVETDTKFQITSNEAQVAYVLSLKDEIMVNFKRITDEEAAAIEAKNKNVEICWSDFFNVGYVRKLKEIELSEGKAPQVKEGLYTPKLSNYEPTIFENGELVVVSEVFSNKGSKHPEATSLFYHLVKIDKSQSNGFDIIKTVRAWSAGDITPIKKILATILESDELKASVRIVEAA